MIINKLLCSKQESNYFFFLNCFSISIVIEAPPSVAVIGMNFPAASPPSVNPSLSNASPRTPMPILIPAKPKLSFNPFIFIFAVSGFYFLKEKIKLWI